MTPQEAIADCRGLRSLLASGTLAAPLKRCKEIVRASIKGNFDSQSAPDGSAWPARKPNPLDDGHPILDDTGFLKAAALGLGPGGFEDVGRREMEIGIDTTVDQGGIAAANAHDHGFAARGLPERHFFAATEAALEECGEVIGDGMHQLLLAGKT